MSTILLPYFDPYQVLINFGFSHTAPVPFLGIGGVKPHEVSNALHEFTHQDGMHSEMGLWYLHLFWKFMARVLTGRSALPLLQREQIWESYWLMSFLLEGQAMFAQLHLLPSRDLEASTLQWEFIKDLGIAYNRIEQHEYNTVVEGVTRLFRESCLTVHERGLKHQLLTSTGSRDHYMLGYLFFRSTQAFLAEFDKRFRDPETFFIFICNFINNNIFEEFSGAELYDKPVGTLFHRIMSAVRHAGPHATALLEPILTFPRHDANYRLTDNLAYLRTGRWAQRRPLDDAILKLHDDIASTDEDMAQLFVSSVLCLQFIHLKSGDVHVMGNTPDDRPLLLLHRCNDGHGLISGTRIDVESARTIQQWAAKKGKALMNVPAAHFVQPEHFETGLAEFAACEMHTIRPLLGGPTFTCLTSEFDFPR